MKKITKFMPWYRYALKRNLIKPHWFFEVEVTGIFTNYADFGEMNHYKKNFILVIEKDKNLNPKILEVYLSNSKIFEYINIMGHYIDNDYSIKESFFDLNGKTIAIFLNARIYDKIDLIENDIPEKILSDYNKINDYLMKRKNGRNSILKIFEELRRYKDILSINSGIDNISTSSDWTIRNYTIKRINYLKNLTQKLNNNKMVKRFILK